MRIVDVHTHMGPMFATRPGMFPGVHATDIIELMDTANIELACTFPPLWQGLGFHDPTFEKANAAIAEETANFRHRLLPFARVNPNFRDQALREMDRCKYEYDFMGLKLHPLTEHFKASNLTLLRPILQRCAEWNWPIFFHTGYYPTCQPALFIPLAEEFPTVPMILAHISYEHPGDAIVVAKRYPNIYIETSANARTTTMRQVYETVGSQQFVYGSDLPFTDPNDVLAKIRAIPGITEEDLGLILGGNILRLFGLTDT